MNTNKIEVLFICKNMFHFKFNLFIKLCYKNKHVFYLPIKCIKLKQVSIITFLLKKVPFPFDKFILFKIYKSLNTFF